MNKQKRTAEEMTKPIPLPEEKELNRIYTKHEHYFQDIMNEGFSQNDYDKIFADFQRLLAQAHQSGIEEVREIAEEMGECNCCKWDDNGFQHEPHCNSKKPIAYFEALDDLLNKLK